MPAYYKLPGTYKGENVTVTVSVFSWIENGEIKTERKIESIEPKKEA